MSMMMRPMGGAAGRSRSSASSTNRANARPATNVQVQAWPPVRSDTTVLSYSAVASVGSSSSSSSSSTQASTSAYPFDAASAAATMPASSLSMVHSQTSAASARSSGTSRHKSTTNFVATVASMPVHEHMDKIRGDITKEVPTVNAWMQLYPTECFDTTPLPPRITHSTNDENGLAAAAAAANGTSHCDTTSQFHIHAPWQALDKMQWKKPL